MKQHRFDEAQRIGILRQQESGVTVAQICREQAFSEGTFSEGTFSEGTFSEGTFYRWKSKMAAGSP